MAETPSKNNRLELFLPLLLIAVALFWYMGKDEQGQLLGGPTTDNASSSDSSAQMAQLVEAIRTDDDPKTPTYQTEPPVPLTEDEINSHTGVTKEELSYLKKETAEAKLWGAVSPYAEMVHLREGNMRSTRSDSEFVTLYADESNGSEIEVTGWKLENHETGAQLSLPLGVRTFRLGQLPLASQIRLQPGETAYVTSGESPTGVSFHENLCTGYLGAFQEFTPPLPRKCPTDDSSTAPCEVSVATGHSYAQCIQMYVNDPKFSQGAWRIFLGSPGELWIGQSPIIKLLDREGRTVSVLEPELTSEVE